MATKFSLHRNLEELIADAIGPTRLTFSTCSEYTVNLFRGEESGSDDRAYKVSPFLNCHILRPRVRGGVFEFVELFKITNRFGTSTSPGQVVAVSYQGRLSSLKEITL